VSDILYRAELHNPEQARAVLARQALPWVGEQLKQGRELVAEFRLLDDDITDKQRAYLHGVVLKEIAQQAMVDGRRFPMKVWKEHFRKEWLGHRTVTHTNPLTGRKYVSYTHLTLPTKRIVSIPVVGRSTKQKNSQ